MRSNTEATQNEWRAVNNSESTERCVDLIRYVCIKSNYQLISEKKKRMKLIKFQQSASTWREWFASRQILMEEERNDLNIANAIAIHERIRKMCRSNILSSAICKTIEYVSIEFLMKSFSLVLYPRRLPTYRCGQNCVGKLRQVWISDIVECRWTFWP